MRTFRVFISSPGDTLTERRRAERVVSRLNGEFAGLARVETVRWETEFYGAHDTFQAQIPPAVDCDVVVGILRWRLGTELPPGFETQSDGTPYPSGTAFEILTAMEKRRAGAELPDVFVFRYAGAAPSIVIGEADEAAKRRHWTALQNFFARWFVSEEGHFTAALNTYEGEDDFERQAEALLRKWVAERVAGGRFVAWPAVKGSPFRGLDVFGARHAPVFFGRAADIRKATDLWREASARFLLVVGASGAGKSSLVRAGLVPRVTSPGVVPEVDLWRVAVLRPADSPEGPFMALASALLKAEADLPPEEEGRGPALPEIAEGDSKTPADLAAVLIHADAAAVRVVVNALARVEERVRTAERHDRAVRCDLVFVLDQAEELFTPSVKPEMRALFAALLEAMVASGRIWLAATLRADFYAAWLDLPVLKALKDAGASYDLAPPGAAELADIVRAPALAADFVFDTDPASGERLDEVLLREADRPDMLPLVQLALSRLWEARETRGDETVLPFAAYRALSGLKGIIAEAGEAALADCDATLLQPLVRRLAELSRGRGGSATLTTRAIPLAEAAPDPVARALVDALVTARLLALSDEAGVTVRLAHQRVLSDWPAAAAIVSDSADFYRVRDEVEDRRRRWEASRRRSDLLLPRGLPLAEARAIAAKYRAELPSETLTYVAASRRRANRAQIVAWSAAALFAAVAGGAGMVGRIALLEKAEAEGNFSLAQAAVDGLVTDLVDGLRNVGLPVSARQRILNTARRTMNRLVAGAPNNSELGFSRANMLLNFGMTYLLAGNLPEASSSLNESIIQLRKITERDSGDARVQRSLASALDYLSSVKEKAGDQQGALREARESLEIRRQIASRSGDEINDLAKLSAVLWHFGDIQGNLGDRSNAVIAYQESLDINRKLVARAPENIDVQIDLAVSLERIGNSKLAVGDRVGALAAYQESLDVRREIAAKNTDSTLDKRNLSVSFLKIGDVRLGTDDKVGALDAYQQSLDIRRDLALLDPENFQAQSDVAYTLKAIAGVKLRMGDKIGALAAYQESLDIRRKRVTKDSSDASAQRDLASLLYTVGDTKLQAGDRAGAVAAYQESLALNRKLAEQMPESVRVQTDLAVSLDRVGKTKLELGDQAGAQSVFEESLGIFRKLATRDADSTLAQRNLSVALDRIGDVKLGTGDKAAALVAYQDSLDIRHKLALITPGDAAAQRDVYVSLTKIAGIKLTTGNKDEALSLYRDALGIIEKNVRLNPGDSQNLHDLSWIHGKIELVIFDVMHPE